MNPLVKKIITVALAVAASIGLGFLIDTKYPLKDSAGKPLTLSPVPVDPTTKKLDTKKAGILILIAALGAAVLYFVGKVTKISILKN